MFRSLLVIFVIVALIYFLKYFRRIPSEDKPKAAIKYGLYIAAVVVIGLVITGKLHWIAAGIAGLLPIAQRLFTAGIRFMPFLKQLYASKNQKSAASSAPVQENNNMTVEKAKDIFGLKTVENREQVTKRHRELMQKNHPDRGGSDYLAAQINEAKECLMKQFKNS
jgi:hypothetical protein